MHVNISNPHIHAIIDSTSFQSPINHYFYIMNYAYVLRINVGYVITGEVYGGNFGYTDSITNTTNSWYKSTSYGKNTSNSTTSSYRIGIYQGNNSYSDGNIYFDGLLVLDLTATFGAGNEPDKAWCDSHINYFDGTTTIYK